MPRRPLPDSRKRRDERARRATQRLVIAVAVFLVGLSLLLYLLA